MNKTPEVPKNNPENTQDTLSELKQEIAPVEADAKKLEVIAETDRELVTLARTVERNPDFAKQNIPRYETLLA